MKRTSHAIFVWWIDNDVEFFSLFILVLAHLLGALVSFLPLLSGLFPEVAWRCFQQTLRDERSPQSLLSCRQHTDRCGLWLLIHLSCRCMSLLWNEVYVTDWWFSVSVACCARHIFLCFLCELNFVASKMFSLVSPFLSLQWWCHPIQPRMFPPFICVKCFDIWLREVTADISWVNWRTHSIISYSNNKSCSICIWPLVEPWCTNTPFCPHIFSHSIAVFPSLRSSWWPSFLISSSPPSALVSTCLSQGESFQNPHVDKTIHHISPRFHVTSSRQHWLEVIARGQMSTSLWQCYKRRED